MFWILFGALLLTNRIVMQYYEVEEFNISTVNQSYIDTKIKPVQYRDFPSDRFVLKYVEISCHDNATGQRLFHERLNSNATIQHTFGPLIGERMYRFEVTFVSKREHGLGYDQGYFYLEPQKVMEFSVQQDVEVEEELHISFKPHPHCPSCMYKEITLGCTSIYDEANMTWPVNTSSVDSMIELAIEHQVLSYELTAMKPWTRIDLDSVHDVSSLKITMTRGSIYSRNVALHSRTVKHYSLSQDIYYDLPNDKAVNGILTGENEYSISELGDSPKRWDMTLDRLYDIGKIVIYPRTGNCNGTSCNEILQNVSVVLTDSKVALLVSVQESLWDIRQNRVDPYGSFGVTTLRKPFVVNRISIIPTVDNLYLAEVEMYEKDDINIALGKNATQSSAANSNTTAEKAVNGQIDPSDFTRTSTKGGWWMVDLGRSFEIEHLLMYKNTRRCSQTNCENELKEITVMTSSIEGIPEDPSVSSSSWVRRHYRQQPHGDVGLVQFNPLIVARHVAILAGESTYLSLSEVQIFQKGVEICLNEDGDELEPYGSMDPPVELPAYNKNRESEITIKSTTSRTAADPCGTQSNQWINRQSYKLVDTTSRILFGSQSPVRSIALCGNLRRPINITELTVYKQSGAQRTGTVRRRGSGNAGDIQKCNLTSNRTRNTINKEFTFLGVRPKSPEIEADGKILKDSDDNSYIEVKVKTIYDQGNRNLSFHLLMQDLHNNEIFQATSKSNLFKVTNIMFGRRCLVSATVSLSYESHRVNSKPGPSLTVQLAPLPPQELIFEVEGKGIRMTWNQDPLNHYQLVYANCSVNPNETLKMDASSSSFIWTNLTLETDYRFNVWTYSEVVDKNSTVIEVTKTLPSRTATGQASTLAYTAIAWVPAISLVFINQKC